MKTAHTALEMRDPRTLDDALALLRDEGPLTPLAGCTDVFVNLHFGTTPDRRFINLWALDELRGIDLAAHGESAYDLHSGTSGGSSSVLAASTAPVTTTRTEGASA